jgi:hypothetical protein
MGPNINVDFIHIHSIFQCTQKYNECSHKISFSEFSTEDILLFIYLKK